LLWQARRTAEPAWYDFTIRATRRFSVVGILSVGALLASGLINSWNLLSGPRDLVISDYGRLVALKIGLFAAMVGIAAVNLDRGSRAIGHQAPRFGQRGLPYAIIDIFGLVAQHNPKSTPLPKAAYTDRSCPELQLT
jgi:putative copper export protein